VIEEGMVFTIVPELEERRLGHRRRHRRCVARDESARVAFTRELQAV
jgi:hypothetical protein